MKIYLDNAATTPLDKEVFYEMTPYLLEHFGNPSSHHLHGRTAKQAIEKSRDTIAQLLNASAEEIIFTSGGTEAHNMLIASIINNKLAKQVITTRFEHHAVLNTFRELEKQGQIKLLFIDYDHKGNLDIDHLKLILSNGVSSLVSVMHANNEIGNINDIELIGQICKASNAIFHTDTVQTVGHYRHNLQQLPIDTLASSAHKFHGPKGVGFAYCRKGLQLSRLLHGGGQERKLRAGTENIPGIVGLAKALELAYANIDANHKYIQSLKDRLIAKLKDGLSDINFNGNCAIADKSLHTLLSVNLPFPDKFTDPLNYLDSNNISVSGGSACSTGSVSHVLNAINLDPSRYTIRFSFSRFNTIEEIDYTADKLCSLYNYLAA
jgi:cysteine desulfurase